MTDACMNDKFALITGTNRGIGHEMVRAFAQNGANVWAHARIQDTSFESYLADISREYGVTVRPLYFELTNIDEMKAAMKPLVTGKDPIDVLVNNAGVAHGGFFAMTKVQTIKDVFEINLFAAMELTQLVLRKMIKQKSGSIINMSSVAGFNVRPGNSAYGVSKAAVKAWTETLACEAAQYGIRVNAIAPSLTDTDMAKLMEEKAGAEMLRASAMGRLATPEEIANVALFLASDNASFVNGQTIIVNGGGTTSNG